MVEVKSGHTETDTRQWRGRTHGTGSMHRLLIWLMRRWPLWMFYFFAAVVMVPPYLLFTPSARRSLRHFYRHVGLRYNIVNLYRSYYSFARAICDRFAAYAGKTFEIEMVNNEAYRELEAGDGGFIMFGSHEGNYELTGYSLKLTRKRLNALLFGGEANAVMHGRHEMFDRNNINIITVVPGSIDHVFSINEAMARGEIVSIPADRAFGSQKELTVLFLGAEAHLPLGPFILAATHRAPSIAVFMMKTGYRSYRLIVRRIMLKSSEMTLPTRLRAELLCHRYAVALEEIVRQYPYQWYNYFDFWHEEERD